MKKKNIVGKILAVIVFAIVICSGFFLGKYIASKYTKKPNVIYKINNATTIYKYSDSKTDDVKPVTFDNIKTIGDLCGFDTGLCSKEVGSITLDSKSYNLFINYDFNNTTEKSAYFKLGDVRIGDFINVDSMYLFNNKYLVIAEPTTGNNYAIHFYTGDGKEVQNYTALYNNGGLILKDNVLYYYNCDSTDVENGQSALKYYNITEANGTFANTEISKEYGKC